MTTRISDELRARIASHWPDILAGIAAGALVRDVLKRASVSYASIMCWIREDPSRRVEWDDAREQSAEAFIDEALDVARFPGELVRDDKGDVVLGKDGKPLVIAIDSAHARTRIDTLKWAARIRNPRAYSDKAQLDVNVKTVDLTRIISEANARLAGRAPRTLEHDAPRALAHAADAALAHSASTLLELL